MMINTTFIFHQTHMSEIHLLYDTLFGIDVRIHHYLK